MPTSITAADVVGYLGIDTPDPGSSDDKVLNDVVAATNVLVPGTVPRVRALPSGEEWPDDVFLAAKMQAAKLFARRRSVNGVSTYSELGGPVYVARWDPDLEKLLRIGQWAPPGFA